MVDIITIDIIAEKPPKKTKIANKRFPFSSGNNKE